MISGDDRFDSDVINITNMPNGLASGGTTAQVTISAGEYNPNVDAGLKWQFPTGVLSITLSGYLKDKTSQLEWNTVDENNVSNFEIERSIDNVNFNKVATKEAVGNTTGNTQYALNDDVSTLDKESVIYYRIKVVDRDANYLYSNTINLILNLNNTEIINVFPIPFVNEVSVSYTAEHVGDMDFTLTDVTGKKIVGFNKDIQEGVNIISIKNLELLSNGSYFLTMTDNYTGQKYVKKITKK